MNARFRRLGPVARRALLFAGLSGCLATLTLALVCSIWTAAGFGFSLGRWEFAIIAHGGGIVEISWDQNGRVGPMGPDGPWLGDRFETVTQVAEAWKDCLSLPQGSGLLGYDWLFVPLWLPLLLSAILTLFAWRGLPLRRGMNACETCGYDLTGNVSRRCSECGTPVSATPRLPQRRSHAHRPPSE